jgi:sterol desaturase/sphingolipid hydroxylase (fatty acid hydroxylase superfamily)
MDAATAAGGEWIPTWLSPVAYFVFDVLFIVLFFVAADLLLKVFRRARHRG